MRAWFFAERWHRCILDWGVPYLANTVPLNDACQNTLHPPR